MSYSHGRADVTVDSTARLAEVMSGRMWNHADLSYLHGHSTLAAARILLQSHGRCSGCDGELDRAVRHARYDVHSPHQSTSTLRPPGCVSQTIHRPRRILPSVRFSSIRPDQFG